MDEKNLDKKSTNSELESKIMQKSKSFIPSKKFLIIVGVLIFIFFIVLFLLKTLKTQIEKNAYSFISYKLQRKLKYDSLSISQNVIKLDNLIVFEKDNKSEFGRVKKLEVFIDPFSILKKSGIVFDDIKLQNGTINLVKNFNWNFQDLIDLFPHSDVPLYKRLTFRNFELDNFDVLIKTNYEFLLKKFNLKIIHPLNSTNFDIKINSEIFGFVSEKSIFGNINGRIILKIIDKPELLKVDECSVKNFSYSSLRFDDATIKGEYLSSKKLNLELKINSLTGYKLNKFYWNFNSQYKKIYSREINFPDTIDLKIKLDVEKNSKISLKIYTDIFNFGGEIDIVRNRSNYVFKTKNYFFAYVNEFKNRKVNSNLSEMMDKIIFDFIIEFEKNLKRIMEVL